MGCFEDDILKMYETIPREKRDGNTEISDKNYVGKLLKSFETIPREAQADVEKAIEDMKYLVTILEKRLKGELKVEEKQEFFEHKVELRKSIKLLKEKIDNCEK